MRSSFGRIHDGVPAVLDPEARVPAGAIGAREIPYDHVATFTLLGQRGNRVQDVINVSIDGTFVAVSIGYSFIAAPLPPAELPPPNKIIGTPTPAQAIMHWLLTLAQDSPTLTNQIGQSAIARLCGIEFKYSIVDSASGRELQNKPIHSLAGLGESSGDRPFRALAKPMLFMPRSTIRIEVEEISEGAIYAGAQLYIVLHGYKVLGQGV
ncbi:MAG: hypothetical protein ACRD1U_11860 [Vicinamibacterales bacterium]